jgi:hypothetical protein
VPSGFGGRRVLKYWVVAACDSARGRNPRDCELALYPMPRPGGRKCALPVVDKVVGFGGHGAGPGLDEGVGP